MRRLYLFLIVLGAAFFHSSIAEAGARKKPNIIFILADDLGYGDLGCYGQKKIKTPVIDQMAKDGMRFTQFYAGSTVCAPSRCSLMVGQHTGHCRVRGNALVPLQPGDVTVAEILQQAGYVTGLVGKWGLGEPESTGVPNLQGFDYFYGYLNQRHAHNSYPDYLWRNQKKILFPGNVVKNGVALKKDVFSQERFTKEALEFIEKNHKKPFFLYFAVTIPHANNERGRVEKNGMEVPSDEPYTKENWPAPQKSHAAMITYLDRDIGKVRALLRKLNIEDDTIIIFTSDNGPHREGGALPDFFNSSGGLRGIKRSLHEGGIRVPCIVVWPGKVKAGTVSDQIAAFWDFMPTAAELAGVKAPANTDGISFLPALLGKKQTQHKFMYWEFHEGGSFQGVRMGKWKAVRRVGENLLLFNLEKDLFEKNDIAAQHPDIVQRIETYLQTARTASKQWPLRERKKKKKK